MGPDRREARQAALRERLVVEGLDVLLVAHLPNIRYLTGFSGTAGALLVREDDTVLVTDSRYATQAPAETGPAARVVVADGDIWEWMGRVGQWGRGFTVGFEEDSVSARLTRRLEGLANGALLRPTEALVEGLRERKDPDEVGAIRQAAALALEAYEATLPSIRVGAIEREVAAALEGELRRRGSEWHPFATIVASGPRSALPHGRTDRRALALGDLVLLDFGAQVDGYCADLTRTMVLGRADERQRMVYGVVRDAQAHALSQLRAGMSGREADQLARGVIAAQGLGEAFGHSLGHGLGLEVHEAPRLGRTNATALPADAVVTVEPGVYLPGWGGVRIEDDVRLTPDGVERLSEGATDLRELGVR